MIAMASVPPDPRRTVIPAADEPPYDSTDQAAPTAMRENTRRVGVAMIAILLAGALVVALILLL